MAKREKDTSPTIIGMDPPTKEVIMVKGLKVMDGYDLLIFIADFEKEYKIGEEIENIDFSELRGLLDWLHFTNAEAMEKFGMAIAEFARQHK